MAHSSMSGLQTEGIPLSIGAEAIRAAKGIQTKRRGKPARLDFKNLPKPAKGKSLDELWASLTPKQRVFCESIISLGCKPSEAYRIAYEASNCTQKSIAKEAGSLAKSHPAIAPIIRDGLAQKRRWTGTAQDAPEIRETSLRVLREIAEQGQVEACRVKSAELLGKVSTVGLFTDRTEVVTRSEASPEAQIEVMSRLQALLGATQHADNTIVIDTVAVPMQGTVEQISAPDADADIGAGI